MKLLITSIGISIAIIISNIAKLTINILDAVLSDFDLKAHRKVSLLSVV